MSRQIYIDGYNVLRKIPRFAKLMKSDADAARRRFVEYLASHELVRKYPSATVVFDGHGEPITSAIRIRVVFSYTRTADSWIVLKLESDKDARSALVVTSDHEVQNRARANGAGIMRAEDFLKPANERENTDSAEDYKSGTVSPDEMQFWLDAFKKGKPE